VEPTEVIVAKASGLFVIDSFTIVNLKLAWIDKVKKKIAKKDAS
jgi:hypothetical protein